MKVVSPQTAFANTEIDSSQSFRVPQALIRVDELPGGGAKTGEPGIMQSSLKKPRG